MLLCVVHCALFNSFVRYKTSDSDMTLVIKVPINTFPAKDKYVRQFAFDCNVPH